MARKVFGYMDVLNASINRPEVVSGTTITKADSTLSYFITSIIGTTVTVKDAAGTTIMVISTNHFNLPFLRLDGGFELSASGTVYVNFFTMG